MFQTGVPLDYKIPVTDRIFTVANCITLVRLLGLPLFTYLILVRHNWLLGFLTLSVVAILDAFDGYVARRFNQATRLGKALDPLADRLTLAMACITLITARIIPIWFAAIILTRDVMLLAVVSFFYLIQRPLPLRRIRITRVGKLATAALLVGMPILVFSRLSVPAAWIPHYGSLILIGAGTSLYYVSLAQYTKAKIALHQARNFGQARDEAT